MTKEILQDSAQRRLLLIQSRRGGFVPGATIVSLSFVVALLAWSTSHSCLAFDARLPDDRGGWRSPAFRPDRLALLRTSPAATRASTTTSPRWTWSTKTQLCAKKSTKRQKESKGFGKAVVSTNEDEAVSAIDRSSSSTNDAVPAASTPTYTPLQSVASDSAASSASAAAPVRDEEDLLTPEERAARILRDKYGMKTLGEQQTDVKQQAALQEQRKKFSEWKKKLDSDKEGDDFDVMSMLPAPVLRGIDGFLKVGVVIAGTAFVLSGVGITLEAWSKTTGNAIDPALDSFIVETIEPNFTTGLLVLLSFSVSLGLFAAAQLGSAGAQYKEDD